MQMIAKKYGITRQAVSLLLKKASSQDNQIVVKGRQKNNEGVNCVLVKRRKNLEKSRICEGCGEENKRVADLIGINPAARTTTVKPAGTTSLTLGTSSGIHAWHNEYYIRRVRVGKNESIYSYLKSNHGELVEDEYFRPHDTAVIGIPQKAPEGSILRNESPIQLLERVKRVQQEWKSIL